MFFDLKNAGVAPVGATPSAFTPMTLPVFGLYTSACVSPPQLSVSHMVVVAASIAQAESTALPPFWNIIAPAVAASGLPVMATQWRPCRTGLTEARTGGAFAAATASSVPIATTMLFCGLAIRVLRGMPESAGWRLARRSYDERAARACTTSGRVASRPRHRRQRPGSARAPPRDRRTSSAARPAP